MTFPSSLFPCISQDAYALGEVFIGSKENSYTVLSGLPPSTQGYHWNHGITIVTPDRKFLFACETEAEQRDWIAVFQRVINRPMRPQEYAGVAKKCLYGRALLNNLIWCHIKIKLHDVPLCVFAVEAHFKHKPWSLLEATDQQTSVGGARGRVLGWSRHK